MGQSTIIMLRGIGTVRVQLRYKPALPQTVISPISHPLKLDCGVLDGNEVELWGYTLLPRPRF